MIAAYLRTYMEREAVPTLQVPDGFDIPAYIDELFVRFGNPHVRDLLARLSVDASNRIPKFFLPVLVDRVAAGEPDVVGASILATWRAWCRAVGAGRFTMDDVAADAAHRRSGPCPKEFLKRVPTLRGFLDSAGVRRRVRARRRGPGARGAVRHPRVRIRGGLAATMANSGEQSRDSATGTVFVVGEALVDVVDDVDGGERRMPGGSPMNVAVGLARLGIPTTALHVARRRRGRAPHRRASGGRPGVTLARRIDGAGIADVDRPRPPRERRLRLVRVRRAVGHPLRHGAPRECHSAAHGVDRDRLAPGAAHVLELFGRPGRECSAPSIRTPPGDHPGS